MRLKVCVAGAVLGMLCVGAKNAVGQIKGPVVFERTQTFEPKYMYGELTKGDAKAIEINLYDEKKNPIYSYSIMSGERRAERRYYFYDEKGNLKKVFIAKTNTMQSEYDEDDESTQDEISTYTHHYKYDAKGRATEDDVYLVKWNAYEETNDTFYYGKIRNSYETGKKVSRHYNADGMEISAQNAKDYFGTACAGVRNKSEAVLGITMTTSNVKKDGHGNIISYDEKIKGWGADYKAKVTVSYKYDKYGNCVSWFKTSKCDGKFIGLDISKATTYQSMQKELAYSIKANEYVEAKAEAEEWILGKDYCPEELEDKYCERVNAPLMERYGNGEYEVVAKEWCDSCKCHLTEEMVGAYVSSVEKCAEALAVEGKYEEAEATLAKLMERKELEGRYDKEKMKKTAEKYKNEVIKMECEAEVRATGELMAKGEYGKAMERLKAVKANPKYEKVRKEGEIEGMIKKCRIGMDGKALAEAERLYGEKKFVESYERVERLQKEAWYSKANKEKEEMLKDKCGKTIEAECRKRLNEATALYEKKDNKGAIVKLDIPKAYGRFISEKTAQEYQMLTEKCGMNLMCEEAMERLGKAEVAKKNKDWQTVWSLLQTVDEGYSHCECYGEIVKMKEKAGKKSK